MMIQSVLRNVVGHGRYNSMIQGLSSESELVRKESRREKNGRRNKNRRNNKNRNTSSLMDQFLE